MSSSTLESHFADRLAAWAADQQNGRAILAALRRGLGKPPGTSPEMFPYVVRYAPAERQRADSYYVVAALFALHPQPGGRGKNLGGSLAQLAAKERERQGREAVTNVDRRFVALLNSHPDDLPDHLRRIVGLLKAAEIPVDWGRLLRDIQEWSSVRRGVQRRWAESYWDPREPARAQPTETKD